MPLSFSEIESTVNAGRVPRIDGERVTTILPDEYETARSVTILDGPDAGNLTVNPDNSLALVMTGSGHTGMISFRVEIENANGTTSRETIELRVNAPSQEAGWGTGENHYMLETDANGDLVIETGDVHRDVYISASRDALSIADIAAIEGIPRGQITGEWLANNPEYGANPNMALDQEAGTALWRELQETNGPNSHWLRLESGYTYDDLSARALTPRGTEGESELHPVVITSYGSGSQPVIADEQFLSSAHFSNIVIHDLEFTERLNILSPDGTSGNVILDSISATEGGRMNVQNANGITVRNVTFHDIHQDDPVNGHTWQQGPDRISSLYVTGTEGVLIEDSVFSEVGWEDNYATNANGNRGQAPSMFSHNVYLNATTTDLTFRDNVTAQAASYGGQLRAGGFIEDNLFLDNNAGFITRGGDYFGYGPIGNFSLLSGNVVTSGAHKQIDGWPGALTRGIVNGARDTVLLDNVVAHLTDPDRPQELQEKYVGNPAVLHEIDPFYDNTVVYRWDAGIHVRYNRVGENNQNLQGLDTDQLDETTAANLAKIVTNNPNATLDDLVDWLGENQISTDELLAYFKESFGTDLVDRGGARDVRFVPSELADGVRWDNRENWSTGDVAGTFSGDRVDLGGNWVTYGGTNTIRSLDFGDGGQLEATHGRLNITGQVIAGTDGATLELDEAGQFWLGGSYTGANILNVNQEGGRFANTGVISGNVNLFIDDGQALLSAEGGDFVLGRGETLTVRGADARTGFDGALNREGIIQFDSGSNVVIAADSSGLGSIGEFRSGAYRDAPRVDSNIHLGGASLTVDLRGAGLSNGTYVLMSADDLTGSLGSFSIQGLGNRSATLTTNYTTGEVTLEVSSGSGVRTRTVGDDNAEDPVVVIPDGDGDNTGGGAGSGDGDGDTGGGNNGDGDTGGGNNGGGNTGGGNNGGGNTGGGNNGGGNTGGGNNGGGNNGGMIAELDVATRNSFVFDGLGDLTGPYNRSYAERINGTSGSDTLTGSGLNEEFLGGRGADVIRSQGGNDLVRGGYGSDRIFGDAGNDIIHAGQDNDIVDGGVGNDVIGGGSGNDRITGGLGADMMTGGRGRDIFLFANDGSDWDDIITDFQVGQDQLVLGNAQAGYLGINDVEVSNYRGSAVISHEGNYILLQDVSVNEVMNNAGSIFGNTGGGNNGGGNTGGGNNGGGNTGGGNTGGGNNGGGNTGGGNNNGMIAELDAATSGLFVFSTPNNLPDSHQHSYDRSFDRGAGDNSLSGTARDERFSTGGGDDTVRARDGDDLIWGGNGFDRLFGDGGHDVIHAGRKNDYVNGGAGNDLIAGAGGWDELLGGAGRDNINGGGGRDQINGGAGADILTGGADDDIFTFDHNSNNWNDIITDFKVGQDQLVLGSARTGYLDINDVEVSNYRGNAVISHEGNYILLQDVSVNEVMNNAGSIFGDGSDLLFA